MGLVVRPVELAMAREFIARHHRHHRPPIQHRFSLGVESAGVLVGVAVAGRPVARMTDALAVLEVARVCTDGTPNACSKLLGTVAAAARIMGYRRVQTFTLSAESGSSLRAVGWQSQPITGTLSFDRPSRPRDPADHHDEPKVKWWRDFDEARP